LSPRPRCALNLFPLALLPPLSLSQVRALTPYGPTGLATASRDKSVKLWTTPAGGGRVLTAAATLCGHTDFVTALAACASPPATRPPPPPRPGRGGGGRGGAARGGGGGGAPARARARARAPKTKPSTHPPPSLPHPLPADAAKLVARVVERRVGGRRRRRAASQDAPRAAARPGNPRRRARLGPPPAAVAVQLHDVGQTAAVGRVRRFRGAAHARPGERLKARQAHQRVLAGGLDAAGAGAADGEELLGG